MCAQLHYASDIVCCMFNTCLKKKTHEAKEGWEKRNWNFIFYQEMLVSKENQVSRLQEGKEDEEQDEEEENETEEEEVGSKVMWCECKHQTVLQ